MSKGIFSASEARQMFIHARNLQRDKNRLSIFGTIKYNIDIGNPSAYIHPNLFQNGNDTYFEGLGYHLKEVWKRNGVEMFQKPPDMDAVPPMNSGLLFSHTAFVEHYIKVSWE